MNKEDPTQGMDVIVRLPESVGQAASPYTHVRIEDAPKLWKLQSQNVQIFGHLPRHKRPKSWSNHRRSSRSSWGKSVWSPIYWINGRKTIWKSFMGPRMEKVPSWECWFVHQKQGLFFRCTWWTSECLQGQITHPTQKKWLKLVDPGERTSFLD